MQVFGDTDGGGGNASWAWFTDASAWCGFSPKQSAADVRPTQAWPEAEGLEEALWVVRLVTHFWPEMETPHKLALASL